MLEKSLILGIESSCDETAAAVVQNGTLEIASTIASSAETFEKYGGVVPEIAARKQVEYIVPVIEDTLEKARAHLQLSTKEDLIDQITHIAATVGPGLIGSLLIGVDAAKSLSIAWNKPLIPVNHLIGHIYGNFMTTLNQSYGASQEGGFGLASEASPQKVKFPAVVLIVSGGHTDLVLMRDHNDLEYLGGTLDDAAGEAFDKTARLLGLSHNVNGGPLLSKKAAECTQNKIQGRLPRPLLHSNDYDFSFSGLKTAVRFLVERENPEVESVACEFETAVVDVLTAKTLKAALDKNAKSVLLAGGVSANIPLRTRMRNLCEENGLEFHVPPIRLCTDNAVYIASAAHFTGTPTTDLAKIRANSGLGVV